jgi:tRNA 2-selenouridine synthase
MRPNGRAEINPEDFSGFDTIIDVRSPAEFALDHIPGSINCPVLDDAQRAEVGTLYKQVSPFAARRVGAAQVSANISTHISEQFADKPKLWRPLIYCWRGGQRSAAMTHVLRAVGWDAHQLPGGYKTWRTHVIHQLDILPQRLIFVAVCGPTGSGKSLLLQALHQVGAQILDLEALAAHRGSVLGDLPDQPQPAQRMFESQLSQVLDDLDPSRPVFVEAESRKIGILHLPESLMRAMRASECVRIQASVEARVELLIREYQHFLSDVAMLEHTLSRLNSLHGKAKIDEWMTLAHAGQFVELVNVLLTQHYDPLYFRSSNGNYAKLLDGEHIEGGQLIEADFQRMALYLQQQTFKPPSA